VLNRACSFCPTVRDDFSPQSVHRCPRLEHVRSVPAGAGHWDLAVRQPLRWGVAGCGKLAEDFTGVLTTVPGATLAAAADEYDAVYRALPEKHMANGVLPSDGLSSLQRAQVHLQFHLVGEQECSYRAPACGHHSTARCVAKAVLLTPDAAQEFAKRRNIPRAYGTYAELAADPEVPGLHELLQAKCVAALSQKLMVVASCAGRHRTFGNGAPW